MRPNIHFVSCLLVAIFAQAATCQEPMFRLTLAGQVHEGTPLRFNQQQVLMLTRSGKLLDFAPEQATDYAPASGPFRSYTAAEMRGQLLREFGQGFEVSGGGRFLVVHPAGQRDAWAPRFEQLHRSFAHYFAARGMKPQETRFPLVAIVFPKQADFARYATAEGNHASSSMLGYYSPATNRIVMYDTTAGRTIDWTINAETIIHEALHQAAFNGGLHNRFGQTPRWVAEGLGTLFEARGVWNSQQYTTAADRVNRSQLESFRRYLPRRNKNAIADLVSSDRAFEQDVQGAYAEAWALTFYLSETEPKKYFQYLQTTAAIKSFVPYRSPERLRDFTATFGSNLDLLNARMLRYLAALP
ncbi:hypothetical protein ETAA8_27840 [Anatilimnocola aggregata]|uniref:DUF1570 domain-containing protein n=1 Tax=Anatilimnocola aggregata TaxID=2528021 RepID=A0A517YBS8_9BACT|nr:DUF1570 domain-containing protein [Anatilimnocola aggregata]QDU27695.1 hypothetical protein ETAA8_27840 [Anatilimnocola aggregata]